MSEHLGFTGIGATVADARPSSLDVMEIRSRFPALAREHRGRLVAYFDAPGGTQVPREVAAAVADYLLHHNANTHWEYPTSKETDRIVDGAREAASAFVGGAPDEMVYGANMTTLAFHLARAIGRTLGPGDEVVVTELDHHANVAPWTDMARDRGVAVRTARMDSSSGTLDWESFAGQLGPRTRLVAVGAASNALGTITDVAHAARLARAANPDALVFVDAVHYAPHELVDVRALGCDFLACSPYKFYGPHAGVLWARRELLASLDVSKLRPAPDEGPARLETGTASFEAMAGATAAIDFLASLGGAEGGRRERLERAYALLRTREVDLFARLWDGLGAIGGVSRYGPPPGAARTGTVSFTVAGQPAARVARRLAEAAVFVSSGDFYAATVAERLGVAGEGFVRAGLACYATAGEVDRLLEAVQAASRM